MLLGLSLQQIMRRYNLILISVLLLLLCTLFACSSKTAPVVPVQKSKSSVLEFMVINEKGSTAILDDEEFGSNIKIVVGDTFVAASGEDCRRATLISTGGEAEIIVACQVEGDDWEIMPRIWGKGI